MYTARVCLLSIISSVYFNEAFVTEKVFQKRIEKEGRCLTDNVRRNSQETASEDTSSAQNSPEHRRLKALTQRWHDIWLRSLAVICRVETLLGLQQEEKNFGICDDLREPPVKKRRTLDSSTSETCSNEPQESEEDIIPFTKDDYERITDKPKMSQLSVNKSFAAEDDTEHQPDVGYSSGENSVSDSLVDPCFKKAVCETNNDEVHLFIDSTPVKSYYKTVPLDDAGVTDTETSRLTDSNVFVRKSTNDVLTDSLMVNIEENTGVYSDDEIENIFELLDDEIGANAEKKYFQAQIECIKEGTKWREISSSQHSKRCSQGSLPVYRQNSCDASSEESEEEVHNESTTSLIKSQSNRTNSLKRPYVSRSSNASSLFKASLSNIDSSTPAKNLYLSQCSEPSTSSIDAVSSLRIPSYHKHKLKGSIDRTSFRRRSRFHRLPRSSTDINRLDNFMSMSTHSAPGATTLYDNSFSDTDDTSQEQSDAPPYEWDDYNPPVKEENNEYGDKGNQQSLLGFGMYDEFQTSLADNVKSIIVESKASLRNANALLNCRPTDESLEDLRTVASANAERLSILALNGRINPKDYREFEEVSEGWRKVLSAIESSTPSSLSPKRSADKEPIEVVLSKVKKFASFLKHLQSNVAEKDDQSKSSICSISSITSLDDVESALKIFEDMRQKLIKRGEEVFSLLHSDALSEHLMELTTEFEPMKLLYEEAIEKVELTVEQVEKVKKNWNDLAETQMNLQTTIANIEKELVDMRKGSNNCSQIAMELELCQERMNRLETSYNYLASSLSELSVDSSTSKVVDFDTELKRYTEAIESLKNRFETLKNPPSSADVFDSKNSKTCEHKDVVEKVQKQKQCCKQQYRQSQKDQLYPMNWRLLLLLCSAALAFFAWSLSCSDATANNWGHALGLHVNYVNGPPPV
uniref:KASH domain-containing protein n=1 Tax=Syphacia muris TaxID=451379 RepID=A0A0N5AA05_9BILA